MRIKTSVGQVALLGGGRNDRSSGILVEERASRIGRGRNLGNLYIVVEVSGPDREREAVTRQIAETIRDTYYGRRGSITAGLQQALHGANNLLFDENRNSLPVDRRTAGASCMVLRDGDLFVAQAGPAVVFLAHEGEVSRLPQVSPWLDGLPPEEMDAAPLGERRDPSISLFHAPVSEGDTVLLANCDLAHQIPSPDWSQVLALEPVEAVLEEVLAIREGHDLSALVVRLGDEPSQPVATALPGDAGARAAPTTTLEQVSGWVAGFRLGERLPAAGRTLSRILGSIWLGLLALLRTFVPERGGAAQASPPSQASAAPETKQRTVPRRPSYGDPVQKILLGVAIGIPIVVGIVVLVTFLQRGQAQRAEMEALWQQANARWEQAQTVSDRATLRTHLIAADQYLEQLLKLRPQHAEAQELRNKVWARLDVISQIRRVSWIGELNAYEEDARLSRVIVQGTHVFVLDSHNGQVYHHQLDEELERTLKTDTRETVLVRKGDQVGRVLVGDLVDMVWMPIGNDRQKASLVILESGGALLDYDPSTGELLPLEVAATDQWQFPELIGSHSGRFYVLDSSANRIWRYNPTPDGYSAAPDEWLQEEIDLAGVLDMAIGDSIYLLYADGQIRRLSMGRLDTFVNSDWDVPPRNPTALFTRPPDETEWLYVGDQGNNRIVQSGKEGSFKQQFRLADTQIAEIGDPLAKLSGLFVDEIGGNAFVLSGNRLYLLILPMSD